MSMGVNLSLRGRNPHSHSLILKTQSPSNHQQQVWQLRTRLWTRNYNRVWRPESTGLGLKMAATTQRFDTAMPALDHAHSPICFANPSMVSEQHIARQNPKRDRPQSCRIARKSKESKRIMLAFGGGQKIKTPFYLYQPYAFNIEPERTRLNRQTEPEDPEHVQRRTPRPQLSADQLCTDHLWHTRSRTSGPSQGGCVLPRYRSPSQSSRALSSEKSWYVGHASFRCRRPSRYPGATQLPYSFVYVTTALLTPGT